jgi:hypothetical protein
MSEVKLRIYPKKKRRKTVYSTGLEVISDGVL